MCCQLFHCLLMKESVVISVTHHPPMNGIVCIYCKNSMEERSLSLWARARSEWRTDSRNVEAQ